MLNSHSRSLCHQPLHFSSLANTKNIVNSKTKSPLATGARKQTLSVIAAASEPHPEKIEIFKSLNGWVEENVVPLLKPEEQCWQPQDLLPDSSLPSDVFKEQVKELRQRASALPDDYLVVLVGNMIIKEAMPMYLSSLNRLVRVNALTGASLNPWATWIHGWTAEENRHGQVIKTYLYLSGCVNMHMIDCTIQHLLAAGDMVIKTESNPYLGHVYATFQERATFVSHTNMARLAKDYGDTMLARICYSIAADEKRHENACIKMVEKLLEVDPNDSMMGIAEMLHKKISMPAAYLMYDGHDPNLFDHYTAVAQRIGIYTAAEYADILDFLVGRWKLEKIEGLNSAAQEAQEFACGLSPRFRKLSGQAEQRGHKVEPQSIRFSWIFDREVTF